MKLGRPVNTTDWGAYIAGVYPNSIPVTVILNGGLTNYMLTDVVYYPLKILISHYVAIVAHNSVQIAQLLCYTVLIATR